MVSEMGRTDGDRHCDECGLAFGARASIEPDVIVDGRYRLVSPLGKGPMGKVFEAHDVHLDRRVAIKLMNPEMGHVVDLGREARALASIRHRNVPVIHAFGIHGRAPFFVMELIEGANLAQVIAQHKEHGAFVPVFRATQIVHHVALALAASHARDIVHRDVKPENVIIESGSGRPVLVDFGIAVSAPDGPTPVRGSPAFMAPEVLSHGIAGPASDLYSLACLTYEVLVGRLPFPDISIESLIDAHLEREPPAPSLFRTELAPYDEVLARALAKDPLDRYPTCSAFASALERVEPESEPADLDVSQLLPIQLGAIRILVVDDDPVFARIAKRAAMVAFSDAEVEVTRARTGEAAVRNSGRVLPQLLLLDFHLPGMDGVEVLARVRALPGGETVSVVVMSGTVGEAERWRFSSLGVRDFIEKPVEFGRLVETIVHKGRERGWLSRVGGTP